MRTRIIFLGPLLLGGLLGAADARPGRNGGTGPVQQAKRVLDGAHRSAAQPGTGLRNLRPGPKDRGRSTFGRRVRESIGIWERMTALPGASLHQSVQRGPRGDYVGSLEPTLRVTAPYPVGTVLKVGELGEVTVTSTLPPSPFGSSPGFVPRMIVELTRYKATASLLRTTQRTLFVPLTSVQPTTSPAGE